MVTPTIMYSYHVLALQTQSHNIDAHTCTMYIQCAHIIYISIDLPGALMDPTSIVEGILPFLGDVVLRTTLASSIRSLLSGMGSSWGSENLTVTLVKL